MCGHWKPLWGKVKFDQNHLFSCFDFSCGPCCGRWLGSAPQVSSFHHRLERQQWERGSAGHQLVRHPGFPEAPVRARLCGAVCEQHESHSPTGEYWSPRVEQIKIKVFKEPKTRSCGLSPSGGPEPPLPRLQSHKRRWIPAGRMGGGEPLRPPLRRHTLLQLQQGLLGLEDFPSSAFCLWVRLPVVAVLLHPAASEWTKRFVHVQRESQKGRSSDYFMQRLFFFIVRFIWI